MQSLSNEELAIRIQGGEKELAHQLWWQVKRFVVMKAQIYYRRLENSRGHSPGFDCEDFIQQGYFAVLSAARYYKAESEASFLTILDYTLKTAFSEVRGVRTSAGRNDALLRSVSGDKPVFEEDGDVSILDTIADPAVDAAGGVEGAAIEPLYLEQLHETLEKCLTDLGGRKEEILRRRYYRGETQAAVAEHFGCTTANIGDQEHRALEEIYESRKINGLSEFLEENTNYLLKVGVTQFKNTRTSAVEAIVLKRDALAQSWLRKHCDTNTKKRGKHGKSDT